MIVVHAPGNGLGHLTRVVAAHHTLGWTGPVVVLSSSARAAAAPLPAGVEVCPIPRAAATAREPLRAWLVDRVRDLEPEELWIDALPAGMWGEVDQPLLESMGDLPVHHLARLVRWPAYERANLAPHRPPHFTSTLLTEALPAPQVTWLRAHSAAAHTVELVDPPAGVPPDVPRAVRERTAWLVVHAGADAEILDLVGHALDHRQATGTAGTHDLVLCTPEPTRSLRDQLPREVTVVDVVPAWPLLPFAHRVVAAAGFNTVRQVLAAGVGHHLVPFPRRWDDQSARARRARETRVRTFPLRA
jgi:predicted glycosyltransferase